MQHKQESGFNSFVQVYNMPLQIKQAQKKEYSMFAKLASRCLDRFTLSEEKFQKRVRKKNAIFLLAFSNHKPVGFVTAYPKTKKLFHIWLLGVLQSHRGKGIATALLKSLHSRARSKGFTRIETLTFNKYPSKIILSLKQGYVITKTKYLSDKKDTAIFFEKKLVN